WVVRKRESISAGCGDANVAEIGGAVLDPDAKRAARIELRRRLDQRLAVHADANLSRRCLDVQPRRIAERRQRHRLELVLSRGDKPGRLFEAHFHRTEDELPLVDIAFQKNQISTSDARRPLLPAEEQARRAGAGLQLGLELKPTAAQIIVEREGGNA